MSFLISTSYYITVYIGACIYIFGFLGSLSNIGILFSKRHNPCTFLLIYSSIIDFFVLNVGLLPRILAVGFNIDPVLSNLIWCKIRTYALRITTLVSIYSVSLMSIERFFVSCRTVRWRQWSNLSFIRWLMFFLTFFIAIEGLPFFILTQIHRTNTSISCTPMYNSIFARYASFFCIPVLYGILPLSIMIFMSILIYYKLQRRIHLRKVQRSLTLIILFRILIVVISLGPYAAYFVYSAIVMITVSEKSSERTAIENYILNIASIILYLTHSSSFFIYYYLSASYRKEIFNVLRYLCQKRRTNTIRPTQLPAIVLIERNVVNNEEDDEIH
ncbi:hypothetical protein I4U23_019771 [Adineta vaga]|nr:hypothetical protein I4U23_019771 [Adineta vaga]